MQRYLFVRSNVQYKSVNIKTDFVILIGIVYQNWFTQCSIRVQVYDQNALLMQSFPEKNDKAHTNKRGFMCHVFIVKITGRYISTNWTKILRETQQCTPCNSLGTSCWCLQPLSSFDSLLDDWQAPHTVNNITQMRVSIH